MPGFGQSDTIAGSQPRQGGSWTERNTMEFTRRDLGKIAIASVPLSRAFAAKMAATRSGARAPRNIFALDCAFVCFFGVVFTLLIFDRCIKTLATFQCQVLRRFALRVGLDRKSTRLN